MTAMTAADAYERRIGRWSRLAARAFMDWLAPAGDLAWLDVGCGTGVLSAAILEGWKPKRVTGIDIADILMQRAEATIVDARVRFRNADAHDMPFDADEFDAAVSGLVINFIEDQAKALAEMKRVVRPGGLIAGYVWDFAGEMELFRAFWDSARALDPEAVKYDQGERFPVCKPGPLAGLFEAAGLESVETSDVVVEMTYRDFDDFWPPMIYGTGGIPDYVNRLTGEARAALRARVHDALPIGRDGGFTLSGRAWTVRGCVPGAAAS